MDDDTFFHAITYPGILPAININKMADGDIKKSLVKKLDKLNIEY